MKAADVPDVKVKIQRAESILSMLAALKQKLEFVTNRANKFLITGSTRGGFSAKIYSTVDPIDHLRAKIKKLEDELEGIKL